MYEELTQDRRESVSLLEKNTKPDTPVGRLSCEHHVLVGVIIVEWLKVWRWLRSNSWLKGQKLKSKNCTSLLFVDLSEEIYF